MIALNANVGKGLATLDFSDCDRPPRSRIR
jgi:hypothetical protein